MDYLTKEELDGLSDKIIDTAEKDIKSKETDDIAKRTWRESSDFSSMDFLGKGSHESMHINPLETIDKEEKEISSKKSGELDLSGMKLVQERHAELSGSGNSELLPSDKEFIDSILKVVDKIKANSVQDSEKTKVQPCHGEHYVSSEKKKVNFKSIVKGIAVVAILYGVVSIGSTINLIDTYNTYLKTQLRQEYTESEVKKMDLPNFIEEYSDLKTAYKELNSDDYNLLGERKDGTSPSSEFFGSDRDAFYVNDKQADAIKSAAASELEELSKGGK